MSLVLLISVRDSQLSVAQRYSSAVGGSFGLEVVSGWKVNS